MEMVKANKVSSSHWVLYLIIRWLYFLLGIPALLFYSVVCFSISDYHPEAYFWGWGCLLLLIAPCLWLYSKAISKKQRIKDVVQKIKDTGYYSPDKDYENISLTHSTYFGIDIRKGTMLYVRIRPNNIMDIIGIDTHNFTRTVSDNKELKIYTKYVNMPVIPVTTLCTSPKVSADTMHAMADRNYDYPLNFPRMVQEKRKEWEKIAGGPVAEVF
ncbi:TPA: plasmid IncI1-type surface exclusion protein ExcA [Salmonella enterica]|uniref:Plasmid IncI1-type surface exclusion protein ExcA n=1 Tax=Salmonella enterica TaxID=28901 RepID=A0A756I5Q0_SALER|nr:plasmid IncI1-type surface exclusion protein ExcA [Salmonella enterica]